MATVTLGTFAGQNWLITPTALAFGEHAPANIHEQRFQLVLSGVVMANIKGNSQANWFDETVSFLPDMAGSGGSGPLNYAISRFGIPKPTANSSYNIAFSVDGWAPFASVSSSFNENVANNSGFAVDVWRPTPFATGTDAISHQPISNIFTGINVDVAVRDTDAWLYRIGYNITLLGKIVFPTAPIIF